MKNIHNQKDGFIEIKKILNKSWIEIKSKDDLPKDSDFKMNNTYCVLYYCGEYSNAVFRGSIDHYSSRFRDASHKLVKEKVTHYMVIPEPDAP